MLLNVLNVKFSYNSNIILNNINFSLNKGEIAVIIGESGTGKSTFLKIINGLISPCSGKIIFKGKNIYNYEPTILRKKICYIPQTPVAIAKNVYSEFKIVNSEIKKENIINLLHEFKLNKNILNSSMNNLSIGQQQRISILRGIINKPDVILLDEPTSALDEDNIDILKEIIENLREKFNISFVIVTHNLKFGNVISNKKYVLKNSILEEKN
jgi:putative ABC transport system ATP-binding protein